MIKKLLLVALLLLPVGAYAQFNGCSLGFCAISTPAPAACASPTAPNGIVDLSQCSNAYYVALIF